MNPSSREERKKRLFISQLRELTGETRIAVLDRAYHSCNGNITAGLQNIDKYKTEFELNAMPDLTGRSWRKAPGLSVTPMPLDSDDTMTKADPTRTKYGLKTDSPRSTDHVIDLTDPEEAQLQKAIKLSMECNAAQPPAPTEIPDVVSTSTAVPSPISTTASNGPKILGNPHLRRRRSSDWPVGLKNVGNTCWFSAVIQSLFNLPVFRNLILHYKPPSESSTPESERSLRNIHFMQELKNLFSLLIGSNQSYVDPSNCVCQLKSRFEIDNKHQQQDASEFTHKLLDWLETAMAQKPESSSPLENKDNNKPDSPMEVDNTSESSSRMETECNPMIDLFYGEYKAHGINNGNSFTKPQNFGLFPLYVDGVGNLHEGLESTTHDRSQQDAGLGEGKDNVGQEHWFTKLPPVLIFELSRFHYNQKTGAPVKIQSRFDFPHLLYMDRYMESNMNRTRHCREECITLTEQLHTIKDELAKRRKMTLGEKSYLIQDVLKCGSEFAASKRKRYVESKSDHLTKRSRNTSGEGSSIECDGAGDGQEMQTSDDTERKIENAGVVEQCLKSWLDELEREKEGLRDDINDIQKRIDTMYDDPALKQHPYDLHAVLVHQGFAAAGHYWAYVKDHRSGKWLKFNDTDVKEASWDELIRDSIGGGQDLTSAYCFMYIDRNRKEFLMGGDIAETILSTDKELKDFIQKHNTDFENEIEEWDIQQATLLSLTVSKSSDEADKLTSTVAKSGGSTDIEKEHPPKRERTEAVANWNVAACRKAILRANTVYDTLGPEETVDHEVLSITLQASMLAIASASNTFNLKGPDEALFEVVRQEFKRLKDIEMQDSLDSDVRLQHVVVYMFRNRAPRKLIERTLLEQFADDRMSYSQTATEIMKSAKDKLETLSAEDLNEEEYQRWHRNYRFFCKATCYLLQGLKLWHKRNFSEALPYLANVKTENDRLTATVTGEVEPTLLADWDLAVKTITICLEELHNAAFIEVQVPLDDNIRNGMSILVDSIVPWIHLLPAESSGIETPLLRKIRNEWCNLDMQTEDLREQYECALQSLMEPPTSSDLHTPTLNKPKNPQDLCELFQKVMSMISHR